MENFFNKNLLPSKKRFLTFYFLYIALYLAFDSAAVGLLVLGGVGYFFFNKEIFLSSAVRPFWYFLFLSVLISILTWSFMLLDEPDYARSSPRVEDLSNKFLFFIPAILLMGNARNNIASLFFMLVALLVLIFFEGQGAKEFFDALNGLRVDFGGNSIRIGMIFGTLFIAGCVFCSRIINFFPGYKLIGYIIFSVVLSFSIIGTISTQSRGVYLSLLVVCAAAVFVSIVRSKSYRVLAFVIAAGAAILALGFFSGAFDRVIDKTSNELKVITQLANSGVENVDKTSMGYRIHFWNDGVQWVSERPVLGWGYRASRYVHEAAGNYFGDRYFSTIHNAYLDILLSYGVLGFLLILIFAFYLGFNFYKAYRSGVVDRDFYIFCWLFFVFYSVNSFFTSSIVIAHSVYLLGVVSSIVIGYVVKYRMGVDG